MFDPSSVTEAVGAFADFLLRYFIALAAVGALTMALIEAIKKLLDLKMRYQMNATLDWFAAWGAGETRLPPSDPELRDRPYELVREAYAQLIHLTTGTPLPAGEDGHRGSGAFGLHRDMGGAWSGLPRDAGLALFALELPRMMGHIQDAASAALRDPARYEALYRFVTSGASPNDAKDWVALAAAPADTASTGESGRRANLYARVHGAVKCKLDAFQLYTDHRWANLNQLAANVAGAVMLFCAILFSYASSSLDIAGPDFALILFASIIGGALAPVAKDLVGALQRVRSGV
jgi:hypothetical protein